MKATKMMFSLYLTCQRNIQKPKSIPFTKYIKQKKQQRLEPLNSLHIRGLEWLIAYQHCLIDLLFCWKKQTLDPMLYHTEATLMHIQFLRTSLLLLVCYYASETHVQLDWDHASDMSAKNFPLFGLKTPFGCITVLLHCSKIGGLWPN